MHKIYTSRLIDCTTSLFSHALQSVIVVDTRPPGLRPNYTDASKVEKFELAPEIYETKTDSVLAWKKAKKLGRFDPDAPAVLAARIANHATTLHERGIQVGMRCRVGGEDEKRGEVMYCGEVEEIAAKDESGRGVWCGIKLDEPVGKNDGSLGGKRYWGNAGDGKFGVFVRPERVEVGDYPVLDDLMDEDLDEI
ncbi:Cap-Gly [Glarea lozoyensis ATCC 20868]|uniref:Cap-Gly n=1 Tax=Glarea lozoyensis (strain ATCC 20868 / MF5171) TaxID=1116229 RepID=S3DYQ1_GLAL2|nr:Cap-Gly [Glarea lozoyensis ATCC 20868]EPE31483.1 Cap-Gly [Glarea lozoyensis ATCC 20868]